MSRNLDLTKWGSDIAKGGSQNETDIREKFKDWQNDEDAQSWLDTLGYNVDDIREICFVLPGRKFKTDLQLNIYRQSKIEPDIINIQIKLVTGKTGFNQVDRRSLSKAVSEWNMPTNVVELMKYFSGEKSPYKKNSQVSNRMFLNELTEKEFIIIEEWFADNIDLIVNDVIKGKGEFAVDFYLITHKESNRWWLIGIDEVVKFYCGDYTVRLSSRSSLFIGRLFLQRKGGDAGRDSAKQIQFKINPLDLFTNKI